MLNQKANTATAQNLANRYNRNVVIWTNSSGRPNIQFEGEEMIQPYTNLHSIITPKEDN